MKNTFAAFVLLSLFTISITAQETEDIPSLKGKFALQFAISQNFTLSSFQGGIISAKYHFTDNTSIRFGISTTVDDGNTDETINYFRTDSTYSVKKKDDQNRTMFGVRLQIIQNVVKTSDILFFVGAGPFVEFGSSERKTNEFTPSNDNVEDYKSDYTNYGLDVLCGIEWFVKSNISISAEYGFYAGFSNTTSELFDSYTTLSNISGYTTRKNKDDKFRFANRGVNFGVSFYF